MTILKERRLELAQEAQRWDDLARHDLLVSTMNDLIEIDLRTGNPINYNMTIPNFLQVGYYLQFHMHSLKT